jgi:biotin carboxyl carrier protein
MAPATHESLVMGDVDHYLSEVLPRLLKLVQSTDITELELHEGDVQLRLHRVVAKNGQAGHEHANAELLPVLPPLTSEVVSPLVGTFYRAAAPGMPPLAGEGSQVEEHTVVGIVEALQVLTEVEAGCRGVVTEVLATDGQPVAYGQVLFEVRTGG